MDFKIENPKTLLHDKMETADCYDDTIIEYPKEQGIKVQKLTNSCIFFKGTYMDCAIFYIYL